MFIHPCPNLRHYPRYVRSWYSEFGIYQFCCNLEYGGSKQAFRSFVRPSVSEDNWFLRKVYEPTTHAPVYWYFEIMILMAPEKRSHKVKLRLKVGTLGDRFLNTFARSFLKNVAKTCRSRLSCQRAGNDHQLRVRHCDVPANVSWSPLWSGQYRRFALPCPAGYCLVQIHVTVISFAISMPQEHFWVFFSISFTYYLMYALFLFLAELR